MFNAPQDVFLDQSPVFDETFFIAPPRPKIQKKIQHREKFTNVENQLLHTLVKKHGLSNWEIISQNMIGRTAKQCRDHYLNYLLPCRNVSPWSPEEDQLLISKYNIFGSKWKKMTAFFNGRSANSIKNRWNYFLSKRVGNYSLNSNVYEVPCDRNSPPLVTTRDPHFHGLAIESNFKSISHQSGLDNFSVVNPEPIETGAYDFHNGFLSNDEHETFIHDVFADMFPFDDCQSFET